MKFFRQTKETKRKLSFFMALAMVISLLPVSPVAKAADSPVNFTVYSNVSGAAVNATSTATGTAIITLTSKDTDKKIKTADITVAIAPKGTTTSGAVSKTVSVNVSGTATAITDSCIKVNNVNSNGEVTIEVKNITQADAIVLNGTITLEAKTPGGNEEPDTPPAEDTCTVTLKSSLGANMTLTVKDGSKTISSGAEVQKDSVLDVEVSPKEGFICAEAPALTVSGASITANIEEANGKYTAKVKVTATKAEIAVSGGKVTKVESTVESPDNNANGATIDSDAMKAPEVLDSILNAFVGIETSGTAITLEKVKELLAVSGAAITTSFKVEAIENEYKDDTTATALADKATTLPEGITKADVAKMIKNGAALDITLNSVLTSGDVKIETKVTELGTTVKITMSIPADIKKADRTYYVIRLHKDSVDILPCKPEDDGKISFESDKFSTYIVTFTDKATTPTPTGGNNSGSTGGIGGYVPSNSATPAPSATAAPSASPSADPSATPGADSSAAPSESATPAPGDGDTTPTKAPTATDKPVDTDKDNTTGGSTAVKVGKKATVSGSQYKVTAVKGTRTVQFTKGKKNAKSIVVPSTVKISGKNYKVTTIAKNAFKGNKKLAKVTIGKNVNKIGVSAFQNCSKLKSIIIKSTKLTAKKVGKNAFKGINKKATFKVPKSKVKAYKKIVKAKGAGKNVKVKK